MGKNMNKGIAKLVSGVTVLALTVPVFHHEKAIELPHIEVNDRSPQNLRMINVSYGTGSVISLSADGTGVTEARI